MVTQPILAASAVIIVDGAIVLVQRRNEPEAGRWTIPGGRVEPGESLTEAAAREVAEETGLEVRVGAELWNLTLEHAGATYELHDFEATLVSGELRPGDDATDARFVPLSEIHELPLTEDLIGYLDRAGLMPKTNSGAAPQPSVANHAAC